MVARQIPDDPDGPEMVSLAQVQDFLDHFCRCPVGGVLGDRLPIDQPSRAVLFVQGLPAVKAGPANAEVAAGLNDSAILIGMLENAQFALNVAVFLVH